MLSLLLLFKDFVDGDRILVDQSGLQRVQMFGAPDFVTTV
jgi:hypothetical protein